MWVVLSRTGGSSSVVSGFLERFGAAHFDLWGIGAGVQTSSKMAKSFAVSCLFIWGIWIQVRGGVIHEVSR